jgi:hypothetical protein
MESNEQRHAIDCPGGPLCTCGVSRAPRSQPCAAPPIGVIKVPRPEPIKRLPVPRPKPARVG